MGRIAMRPPRGKNKFLRSETTRLCRAVLGAGLNIHRVECDPVTGKIAVFPGKPETISESVNDFDKWMEKHNANSTEGS
jgi:hypothetical protein